MVNLVGLAHSVYFPLPASSSDTYKTYIVTSPASWADKSDHLTLSSQWNVSKSKNKTNKQNLESKLGEAKGVF